MKRIAMLAAIVLLSTSRPQGTQDSPTRVVHIVAERFAFTPSEVTVERGTILELRLTSEDTSHGFRLIAPSGTNVEIPKRGRGDIRVTIDTRQLDAGRYAFECSHVCGAGHSFMRGEIRVVPAKNAN